MLTYVSLYHWTEQGIKNVKDTVKRAEAAQATIEGVGGRLITLLWTQGAYDLISIAEFPDEDTAMAYAASIGMQGNVRTETLRAFSANDIKRILQKLP